MRELYKAMFRAHAPVFGTLVLFCFSPFIFWKWLGPEANCGFMIGGYYCLAMAFMKPYYRAHASFIENLPLKRSSIFFLLAVETLLPILGFSFLVALTSVGALVFKHQLNAATTSAFASTLIHNLRHVPLYVPFAMMLGVLSFIGLIPVGVHLKVRRQAAHSKYRRSALYGALVFVTLPPLFFVAPLLLMFLAGAILISFAVHSGFTEIFPSRRVARWTKSYAAGIAILYLAYPFVKVELLTPSYQRNLARSETYGAFAPNLDRAEFIKLYLDPKMSANRRIDLASLAAETLEGDFSADDLERWSKSALLNEEFFSGLTMFQNLNWTPSALVALETELSKRCAKGLRPSKFEISLVCDIGQDVGTDVSFKVLYTPELEKLIVPEHAALASLLMTGGLREKSLNGLSETIRKIASVDQPVLANQAKNWLSVTEANPTGEWDCKTKSETSVCPENGMVASSGIKLESSAKGRNTNFIRLSIVYPPKLKTPARRQTAEL